MTKIIYPKTFNVIDKWVAHNLLLGKVLPQRFVIVNGGTSILVILQPLLKNTVKCVSISENNFGEINVRKVQRNKDEEQYIKNDNHMYSLENSKSITVNPQVYKWVHELKISQGVSVSKSETKLKLKCPNCREIASVEEWDKITKERNGVNYKPINECWGEIKSPNELEGMQFHCPKCKKSCDGLYVEFFEYT